MIETTNQHIKKIQLFGCAQGIPWELTHSRGCLSPDDFSHRVRTHNSVGLSSFVLIKKDGYITHLQTHADPLFVI